MILVDTSVWVDHLRQGNSELATALEAGEVVCHDFVIGELACSRLSARPSRYSSLSSTESTKLLRFAFASESDIVFMTGPAFERTRILVRFGGKPRAAEDARRQ